jgi:hypothetical protein
VTDTDPSEIGSHAGSMVTDPLSLFSSEPEPQGPAADRSTGLHLETRGHATTADRDEIDRPLIALQALAEYLKREQQLLEVQRAAIARRLAESHRATEKVFTIRERIARFEGHGPIAGAETICARLSSGAVETAARLEQIEQMTRLQQIEQITEGFRDNLTLLETDVRAMRDSARRPAGRDCPERHGSQTPVNTPWAVMIRPGHRWAVAAALLLVGLAMTRSFSPTIERRSYARAWSAHPLLNASALVLPPTALMSISPAVRTAAVTTAMPDSMHRADGSEETADRTLRGSLAIQSNPVGGAVFVNQRYVGDTPIRLPRWRPGTHVVWVERAGYQRWTRAILVPADQVTRVQATLASERAQGARQQPE